MITIYIPDCRTPICNQGYYFPKQSTYVDGARNIADLKRFIPFMGNSTLPQRLLWPYSNPGYNVSFEKYVSVGVVIRSNVLQGGIQYAGPADWSAGNHQYTYQGGMDMINCLQFDTTLTSSLHILLILILYLVCVIILSTLYSRIFPLIQIFLPQF